MDKDKAPGVEDTAHEVNNALATQGHTSHWIKLVPKGRLSQKI